MKTEKDFKEGAAIIFTNDDSSKNFSGEIDYSTGEEKAGYIRVRQVCYNSLDDSDIMHIPINQIYD